MAKRAGRVRVRVGSGQSGHGSKRVTGQNGSFLNGSIGLRVKRVAGQTGRVKTGLTRFAMSTSNGNSSTAITITEVVDNDLAIIPRLDGYNSQHPCTSEINDTSPEIVVHTDAIEIEHNSKKK